MPTPAGWAFVAVYAFAFLALAFGPHVANWFPSTSEVTASNVATIRTAQATVWLAIFAGIGIPLTAIGALLLLATIRQGQQILEVQERANEYVLRSVDLAAEAKRPWIDISNITLKECRHDYPNLSIKVEADIVKYGPDPAYDIIVFLVSAPDLKGDPYNLLTDSDKPARFKKRYRIFEPKERIFVEESAIGSRAYGGQRSVYKFKFFCFYRHPGGHGFSSRTILVFTDKDNSGDDFDVDNISINFVGFEIK
ncbi:hypothetical protein B5C34_05370 [Pacificimonas flava]|uniref:Uncharacterized protein n=2 Tax=Pacificimonas TaxID=1960290 RepID=A0A219B3I5_9SPHN|nr:hypothetical protein B5C34_05370 [Pacificimonas flava]